MSKSTSSGTTRKTCGFILKNWEKKKPSLKDKREYFEEVKRSNFFHSSRLEK